MFNILTDQVEGEDFENMAGGVDEQVNCSNVVESCQGIILPATMPGKNQVLTWHGKSKETNQVNET